MMVPMPAAIVLIVCKTVISGPPDQNAGFTRAENREWATEHAMMVCRRQEVQMYDQAEAEGADPQPFNAQRCQRSAMMLGPQWDAQHKSSSYRFWRVACPVPIVRRNPDGSEDIIAWKLPDCGHRDTVVCEVDTAIQSPGPGGPSPVSVSALTETGLDSAIAGAQTVQEGRTRAPRGRVMPLFTPGGYVWSPPWIESNIGNEPDGTSLSGAIFYDFLAGRLGCLMKVKLWGSDDDSTNMYLLRSEVGVDLERVQVPGSAGRTAVKAVFECVASSADTNTDDEYGTSEIDVSWSSRPYVVVDDGRRGDLVYSDNDNENLMRAKQSAGDSPITPLLGVFGYEIPQRMPGDLVTFSVELDRPAPQQIRRIFVGVEDVVSASSNDVSYEVSIDSHWLLKQIDVIYF